MIYIQAVLIITFIYFVGYYLQIVFSFLKFSSRFEKFGFAYGLGSGAMCLQLFIYSFTNISWSVQSILLPWIIFLVFTFRSIHYKELISRHSFTPFTIIEKLLIFLLILACSYIFVNAVLRPVSGWDAIATWFMTGKAFYMNGSIDPAIYIYVDHDSPPFASLLVAFASVMTGNSNNTVAPLLFTSYFFSLIIVFYFTLKRFSSRKIALLFTFFLAVTNPFIRQSARFDVGYADLPLAYYFFVSAVILMYVIKNKSWRDLVLLNILLGVASLIKNEGMSFFFIAQLITFFLLCIKKEFKRIFILSIGFSILGSWWIFRYIYNIQTNYLFGRSIDFQRVPVVMYEIIKEFFQVQHWNLLWIVFIIAVIINRKKLHFFWILLSLCILQLLVYIYAYLVTPLNPASQINNSFDRLLLHISAIAMLYVGVTFSSVFLTKEKTRIIKTYQNVVKGILSFK